MKSSMMQNPCDPEDKFRSKAGKEHQGYMWQTLKNPLEVDNDLQHKNKDNRRLSIERDV